MRRPSRPVHRSQTLIRKIPNEIKVSRFGFRNTLFKPETPKITLYLVLAQGRLTLQVVWLGLAHFQLPVRPSKPPSPPIGENPGRPSGGGAGDRARGPGGVRFSPLLAGRQWRR